jgi:hypothetical protein
MALIDFGTTGTSGTPILFGTGVGKFLANQQDGIELVQITSGPALNQNTREGRIQPFITLSSVDSIPVSTALGKFLVNQLDGIESVRITSGPAVGQDSREGRIQPFKTLSPVNSLPAPTAMANVPYIEKGFLSGRGRVLDLDLYGVSKSNTLTTPTYQFWS